MTQKLIIAAIVAMDEGRVIGINNGIPWKLPEDQKRFALLTKGHTVLMGRKTYESLPAKFRPLPGRTNVVVTRNPESLKSENGIQLYNSPQDFLDQCIRGEIELISNRIWIIGGEQIYAATRDYWNEVDVSLVKGKHEGDAFFPDFESEFEVREEEDFGSFRSLRYERKR